MSFDSLNNNNDAKGTFSSKKDEETKKNLEKTLASTENKNTPAASSSSIKVNVMSKQRVKKNKQSYTFSLSEEQMEKFNRTAREKGYKGRSDFLAAIIDSLE
jgi:hypothetical protein